MIAILILNYFYYVHIHNILGIAMCLNSEEDKPKKHSFLKHALACKLENINQLEGR